MPEYLAPGVYVEEVSFRAKSIEGVSTSTTAFIGPARFGPLSGEPELLTSFNQFERIFGGLDQLAYALETDLQATPAAMTNYLAHAVRAFFANGGRRLYVARAFRSFADVNKARAAATPAQPALALPADQNGDGIATRRISVPSVEMVAAGRAAEQGAAAATAALQVAIAAVGAAQEAADAVREAALIALQALVQGILPADVSPPMIDLEVASAADIKTALQKTANTLTDEKDTAQAALTAENNNIKTAAAAHDSAALQAALDRIQAKLPAGRTLPAIDLTTATEADIINQIKALIDTLPNTKTSAQTALNTAEPQIKAAADARDKGKKTAGNADSAESSARAESLLVGGAINAGYADGDAVAVPDLITANAEAKTKADAVKASVDDAEAKTKDAGKAERDTRTAIAALHNASVANRVSRAADALTRADAAVTAATGAVTSAASARQAARDAARSSRIAARSAEAAVDIGMFRARFPGVDGNLRLVVTARASQNLLSGSVGSPRLSQVKHRDLVLLTRASTNTLYIAESKNGVWLLVDGTTTVALNTLDPQNDTVRAITFSVQATGPGAFAQTMTWENLTVHSERRDGVLAVFGEEIPNRTQMLETPLVLRSTATPVDLAKGLLGSVGLSDIGSPSAAATGVTQILVLAGGNDGVRPTAVEYEGQGGDEDPIKSGLKSFEDLEEISILAAPGVSYGAGNGYRNEALQATQSLISHCERMRYRVAVLDSPDNQSLSQVRQSRAILDTTRAAIYYPWVRVQDPITREPINVPPSGFVAGIYARNDVEQGVHKAPANEVVIGAIGLETLLNTGQQDVLNPLGINCIRFFENRGIRVWGARTLSSDPEWKYLNIRRYFAYLERSIEKSTQWAVFEPNGDALWANVRRAVEDYLFNEWKSERLFGANPDAAFFVRCDRSTMTQNDLDNGRMICLIGVAPLYPAEFVIFRIGQWTADRPA